MAKVIVNLIKGKGGAPAKYAKQGTVQLLSLGRSAGRMLLPFGECPQCCAVSIKSKARRNDKRLCCPGLKRVSAPSVCHAHTDYRLELTSYVSYLQDLMVGFIKGQFAGLK